MILDSIGYVICESAITGFEKTNILKEENGKVIAEGVLQTADETNRNRRFYSSEELFPQLKSSRILELLEAGYLRGELGHPLSQDLVRQQTIDDSRTSVQYLKIWTEGNNIWARFRGTNNAFGEAFNKDLLDGCKPAFSLRALGSIVKTEKGNEVRNLRIITWDQVIYPSHPSAYTRRLLTENPGYEEENDINNETMIIPITNSDVESYIRHESANLKYLEETFDFAYDNISLNKEKGTVMMTSKNTGELLVVNLESYISNEIMNYCSNNIKYYN